MTARELAERIIQEPDSVVWFRKGLPSYGVLEDQLRQGLADAYLLGLPLIPVL